ncbi:MAG: VOC family protein [Sphaerochaetaceae bacterium]|jgi:methylmalonyl-CoA/ethylmalonyl-CoA epimerase
MIKRTIMLSKLDFLKEKEIAQVAFVVKDLDEAVSHYYEVFGIGPWSFYTYQKPFVKEMSYRGKPANYSMRIALSNIGPMRIELIQNLSGESVYKEFIENHGYGIHHLGVVVDDIEKEILKAKSIGIEMIMDGKGFGLDGDGHYAYLDTEDLIGTTIELISRPKRRHEPELVYPLT